VFAAGLPWRCSPAEQGKALPVHGTPLEKRCGHCGSRTPYWLIAPLLGATFSCNMTKNDGSQKQLFLKKASDLRIQRHVKILGTANPFVSRYEKYFEKRTAFKMADRLSGRRKLLAIRQRQKGRWRIHCE